VTIYKESATKTISVAAMQSDTAQIIIPPGRRDYTIIVPDGNPRKIGARILLTKRNVGGNITLKAQNTAIPQALFVGLNEIMREILDAADVTLVNSVENGNVYDFGLAPTEPDEYTQMFVSTNDAVVVENTTVIGSVVGLGKGNQIVKANSLKVGDCFIFRAGGVFSAAANPTLRMKLMFGTLFIGDTLSVIACAMACRMHTGTGRWTAGRNAAGDNPTTLYRLEVARIAPPCMKGFTKPAHTVTMSRSPPAARVRNLWTGI